MISSDSKYEKSYRIEKENMLLWCFERSSEHHNNNLFFSKFRITEFIRQNSF